MKISTAVFASIVAICCTVQDVALAQIQFQDGSWQHTAANDEVSGEPFSEVIDFIGVGKADSSTVVPAGKELVVLWLFSTSTNRNLTPTISSELGTNSNDRIDLFEMDDYYLRLPDGDD